MLAALLAEARPVALEDDVLVLVVSRVRLVQQAQDRGPRQRRAPRPGAAAGRPAARSACASSCTTARRSQDDSGTPPVRLTEDELIDALQERVRRRGTGGRHRGQLTPRRRENAAAEHQQDAEAGPADAGRHDEGAGAAEGRGGRGLGRRRHGDGQDLRRPRGEGDHASTPPRSATTSRARGRRDAPGHGAGGRQRGDALGAGARRRASSAASPAAWATSACPGLPWVCRTGLAPPTCSRRRSTG